MKPDTVEFSREKHPSALLIVSGVVVWVLLVGALVFLFNYQQRGLVPLVEGLYKIPERISVVYPTASKREPSLVSSILHALMYREKSQEARVTSPVKVGKSRDVRGLGYSGQQKIVETVDGDIFVAYRRHYQDWLQIFLSYLRKQEGGYELHEQQAPLSIGLFGTTQRVPSLSVDDGGVVHLVWYGPAKKGERAQHRQIHYSVSRDPTRWGEGRVIDHVEGYQGSERWQEHPDLFVGAGSRLFAVWEGKDSDHSNQQVKFSRSLDGGSTWSSWQNIAPSENHTQSRPSIVEDSRGRLHVVMYSSQNSSTKAQEINYSYSDDRGVTWSSWRTLSQSSFDARHASLAVYNDQVHVAYRTRLEADGKSRIMYVTGGGEVWSNPIPASSLTETSHHYFPSIGVAKDGDVCVAWMQAVDSSGYPREDPQSGDVYAACLAKNRVFFGEPVRISAKGQSVYPNIPQTFKSVSAIPIVYLKADTDDVIFQLVNMPHEQET